MGSLYYFPVKCCGNCVFFDRLNKSDLGYCRRFPPQMSETLIQDKAFMVGFFPMIEEDNWCGEYQSSEDED